MDSNDPVSPEFLYAVIDVLGERRKQDIKWGEQNHTPEWWLAILGEEYGELCQCVLHRKFGGDAADGLYNELVQTAAVAIAMLECGHRNGWFK